MKKIILILTFVLGSPLWATDIKVESPYVRLLPPSAPTTAAFMKLINSSPKEVKLINASSDCCNLVELHTHIMEDGMMKMRQVKSISIPAKANIELKPGSFHIMLIGLKSPLKEESIVKIKLNFDNKETIEIKAKAKTLSMPQMHH